MKKLIAVAVLLFAAASFGQYKNTITGAFNAPLPDPLLTSQGYKSPPSMADYEAAGWVALTSQDYADIAAQQAAIESNAALYADPQPAVFLPRISGSLTNIVGLSQAFVDDATDEVVVVDETGSPEKTLAQKQAQRDAQKTERVSWSNMNITVKASVSNAIVDAGAIAKLTNNYTSAQCKTTVNDLVKEHEDLAKELQAVRRLIAKYAKEDDQ